MERLTLDEHLTAARMARHWVCDHCPEEHLPEARRWIAELLTSELVANALEHGEGPLVITLTHDDEGILVGISDGNTSFPALQQQAATATSGRGIAIVDALATTWGYYPSHVLDRRSEDSGDWERDGWPVPDDERGPEVLESPVPDAFPDGNATTRVVRGPAGKTVWFHLATG